MGLQINVNQNEDGSWDWSDEHKDNGATHDDVWEEVLDLQLLNIRELNDSFYAAKTDQERRDVLWKCVQLQLDSLKESLREELKLDVKFNLFVDKFAASKELYAEVDKRGYSNIVGLKAEITEEEYMNFLEALPPLDFDGNTFYMSEYLTGDVTTKFWEEKSGKYFMEVVQHKDCLEIDRQTR